MKGECSALREVRILLAWKSGHLRASEAEALLGVERGELWALVRKQVGQVRKGEDGR